GQLAFNRSDTVAVANAISGGIGVVQQGTGVLTLTGNNTYTGNTTIATGATLQLGSSATAIPSGTGKGNVLVDGTLDLNGSARTINGLQGTGTITSSVSGTVALTVGAANQTSTFDGTIENGAGAIALAKVGT